MKYAKWFALFLALTFLFTFTACKKESTNASSDAFRFKVGVIYAGDPAEGAGESALHEAGILFMRDTLGLSDDQIIRKTNIDEAEMASIKAAISECIEGGASIIFGTSPGYMAAMEDAAKENPHVIFSRHGFDASKSANMNHYSGRIYEGEYLSGIAAGLATKSNSIGYITDSGKESAETSAFAMGVNAVNPNAKIHVRTIEKDTLEVLPALGCDVLAQSCTIPAPLLVDKEHDALLLSPVLNWGVYYAAATGEVMEGRWSSENYCGGISDGLVTFSPLSGNGSRDTIEAIEAAQNSILSGELKIFEDTNGESRTFENIIE